jgi:hypothetical protein
LLDYGNQSRRVKKEDRAVKSTWKQKKKGIYQHRRTDQTVDDGGGGGTYIGFFGGICKSLLVRVIRREVGP